MGLFTREKIDPDLERELMRRGMTDKLAELRSGLRGTSAIERLPGEFGDKFVGFAKATEKGFGTGLGAKAIATPIITAETKKVQDELERRDTYLRQHVAEKLRDPNVPQKQKVRMVELLKSTDRNIIKDLPELNFTEKQVAGDAVSLGLLALSGYKPGLKGSFQLVDSKTVSAFKQLHNFTKAMSAAERVKRYGTVGKALNVLIAKGVPITKDAIIGAMGFGAAEASAGGSNEQIIKKAKIGAVVGATLPIVVGGVVRGVSAGTKFVGKKVVGPLAEKVMGGLRTAAAGTNADETAIANSAAALDIKSRLADVQNVMDDFVKAGKEIPDYIQEEFDMIKGQLDDVFLDDAGKVLNDSAEDRMLKAVGHETTKQRIARAALEGIEAVKSLPQKLLDRFSPIERIQANLSDDLGRPLTEAEKVYRNFRMTQAVGEGRAEVMLKDFFDDFKQYDDISDKVKARIINLDLIDRAAMGQKVATGQTVAELADDLDELVRNAGENNPRVEQAVASWNDFHEALLKERVDAGLISQETYDSLRKAHPNYMPHNVIMDIDEKLAGGFGNQGSLNVPKTDLKTAFGSLRKLDDPYVALTQRTPIATTLIEKNKTLVGLVEAQEATGIVPGMQKLADDAVAKPGEFTINLFRDGQKETWLVPKDVAVAVKNLDYQTNTTLMKALTWPNRLLKKFATQYNISFTIPNLLRDRQTAAVTADAFIKSLVDESQVVPNGATYTQDDLYRLWKESGGAFGSIFREGAPTTEITDGLQAHGIWEEVSDNINPVKLVDKLNKTIEESTRLQVFQEGLSQGLSPKDAAFAARDATVDFAKMGTFMQQLNQVVPFLNARVQGLVNTIKAAGANPEHFARIMMYTAVYPTMVLQNHNRQFKSYNNIPQYFKDNYWNIMTGEVKTMGDKGEEIMVPQFISIRKGEGQQLIANPVQHFLDKADGLDYRTTGQMIMDTIGNASPVNFSSYDSKNPWTSLLGSFGPIGSIPVGLSNSNLDPYTGLSVVPKSRLENSPRLQYDRNTPDVLKDVANTIDKAPAPVKQLADTIGVSSPAKLEFILRSFGGVPTDVVSLIDIFKNVAEGKKPPVESISGTPFGTAANVPLGRRFFREVTPNGSPEMQSQREKLNLLQTEEKDRTTLIKEKMYDVYRQMNKIPTFEGRKSFLELQNLTAEEKTALAQIKRAEKTVEVLTTTTDADVRARYILWRISEMKAAGVSLAEREAFLNQLQVKKILTKEVEKRMKIYKAQSQ